MKNLKKYGLIGFALLLVACNPSTYEDISSKEEIPADLVPTYTANIAKILSDNCVGCHSVGGQFPNLTNFTNARNATQNGEVICRISGTCGSVMPPSGALSKQAIDLIKLWQEKGYKE
jgi:mono/diheme cytochrome c family protein